MRVVLLDPSGQIGGAERVLLDCIQVGDGCPGATMSVVTLAAGPLADAARALGAMAVVVEAPSTFSRVGDAFASAGNVIRSLLGALLQFPAFFRRFSRAVSGLTPQLIHSHGIKTHVLAALLARRAPLVWHLHDYLGMRSLSARLLALLSRRCSLAIAVSESVAVDARRCLPEHLPIVVVHNSVDCERFHPDGSALDLDALSGLPPAAAGTVRVGLPATFARWKGHDVFLSAIARLRRSDVRAYVIGGALYETTNSQWSGAELRALVQSHGLDGQVGFTGLLEDMPSAYRALDIVVHASTRPEPFGLVIAEAMACGRAVIAAPEGGAGELFADGEQAIAVRSGDDGALAAALEQLIDAPAARMELGARARAHVVRSFGRARFATDLHAVLASFYVPPEAVAAT
jgi:glycosyltransferase involved in cell wall biosynthesis